MARALLLHPYGATVRASSSTAKSYDGVPEVKLSDPTRNYRVLVLGGTGRVGGSTATALSKLCPKLRIVVGGRNREKGEAMVAKLGENSEFAQVDINDAKMLETSLRVHAAGPFQQAPRCTVLEAAIKTKTAYLDVCDDTSYAFRAKSLEAEAVAANIPAITTAGIYPGVSNVMAAEMVTAARSEDKGKPEKLRFSYYTAGTGGAGPTILATSFLLLGEEVIAYKQGEKVKLRPYSGMINVDFGKGIRKRDVYLLNLPEVRSTHEVLEVPTVSARFGTAPFFWNWGMEIMTKVLSPEVLRDRTKVQQMVELFDPVVRAMDGFSGERVSMRVDLECSDGRSTVGIYSHKKLSVAVGVSTAAFVLAMLEGSTQPGVWFPEEPQGIAVEAREALLSRASQGTFNFILNKPPWMVETVPKEVILGIYV
ncbi:uncharacterized protein LOC18011049 isoform X2 [Eutrema salsugineum]|uniref:uncharacterized protein LOC18011049 isoform X2 n=1 Tax=Eutrema salsugineum TaxID=72664 RepID=UPI000CED76FE|nr:uncharacterized protein LOC18011049 isoform X2 [Eutrema salsugineum]